MGTLFLLLVLGGIGYAGYRIYQKQQSEKEESGQTTAIVAGGGVTPARRLFGSPEQTGLAEVKAKKTKLKNEKIVQQWSSLIGGAQGKGEEFTKFVIKNLQEVGAPNLKAEYMGVSLGMLSEMFKGNRRFLVVDNRYFKGYRAFIGARDYGKQLSVSWYLTFEETFWSKITKIVVKSPLSIILLFPFVWLIKILHLGRGSVIPELMDLFDLEEFNCYISTVQTAVKGATNSLLHDLNLDFTKVDVRSRGFHNTK